MITFLVMRLYGDNQVSHALAITQLSEHQRKQLVPTGEVLHIAIAIILANMVVKLSPVQKSGKLSKNVFALEHSSQLIWLQNYIIKSVSFQKPA